MTAHTPGPWHFDGHQYDHIVWSSDRNRVCFLTSTGPTEANARLIAAAPDLLAALKDMVDGAPLECGEPDCPDCGPWRTARAAIAKAEGRTNENVVPFRDPRDPNTYVESGGITPIITKPSADGRT